MGAKQASTQQINSYYDDVPPRENNVSLVDRIIGF